MRVSFFVSSRWGGDEVDPTIDRMREVLAELEVEDDDHPDVSLQHESGWCLSAFSSGLLVWENVDDGDPRHMRGISREKVLDLWIKLSQGMIAEIDLEPWVGGYG